MKNLLVDFKFALPIFSSFSIKLKLKYKHHRATTALEKEFYVLERRKHHIISPHKLVKNIFTVCLEYKVHWFINIACTCFRSVYRVVYNQALMHFVLTFNFKSLFFKNIKHTFPLTGFIPKIRRDGLVQNAIFALLSEQWNIFDGKNDGMTMRQRMYRPRPFFQGAYVRTMRPNLRCGQKISLPNLRLTSGYPQNFFNVPSIGKWRGL